MIIKTEFHFKGQLLYIFYYSLWKRTVRTKEAEIDISQTTEYYVSLS